MDSALGAVHDRLGASDGNSLVFFANAHTLDLAARCTRFTQTLNEASLVLCDGVGIRLGARLNGIKLGGNLCGTDFVPRLLSSKPSRRFRYFLLGASPASIANAAQWAAASFPHWEPAGFHHGYFGPADSPRIVAIINAACPDLLLVGMGSPRQERWLVENRGRLRATVGVSVGGLFDFWSGRRTRAPLFLRQYSLEWLHIGLTEPHKWRRYAFGAPRYLAYVVAARLKTTYRPRW